MDYSVKITLKRRRAYYTSLFMFVKNHIFTILTSEWTFDDLEVKLTLTMTLNHQNNDIIWIFQSKSYEKEVLHTFSALFVKKW